MSVLHECPNWGRGGRGAGGRGAREPWGRGRAMGPWGRGPWWGRGPCGHPWAQWPTYIVFIHVLYILIYVIYIYGVFPSVCSYQTCPGHSARLHTHKVQIFVWVRFFENAFSPKSAPKNSQNWGLWGVWWGGGGGVGFRVWGYGVVGCATCPRIVF